MTEHASTMPSPGTALAIYRHVGSRSKPLSDDTAEGRLVLRRDLRSPNGPFASAIGIFMQDLAGVNIFRLAPLIVPVQIDIHIRDSAAGVSELTARGEIVRRGRTLMVTRAQITGGDRLVAHGTATWATMGSTLTEPGPWRSTEPDAPDRELPPLLEWLGGQPRAAGDGVDLREVAAELQEPVALGGPSTGTLHGGPLQILTEAAAWQVAQKRAPQERLMIQDFSTLMMSPARAAPFAAVGEIIAAGESSLDCRVEVRDEAGAGKLAAMSLARFSILTPAPAGLPR
jgi:acyl-coenzyme A thioesterase PaaI-like protein